MHRVLRCKAQLAQGNVPVDRRTQRHAQWRQDAHNRLIRPLGKAQRVQCSSREAPGGGGCLGQPHRRGGKEENRWAVGKQKPDPTELLLGAAQLR